MSDPWIIWESKPRWAPAMRVALAQYASTNENPPPLVEVRELTEAHRRIQTSATSVFFVEVAEQRLGELLRWLSTAAEDYPKLRIVALLDGSTDSFAAMEAVLREAGVTDVTASPRQLPSVLTPVLRHTQLIRAARLADQAQTPLSAQVWNSLPWQAD